MLCVIFYWVWQCHTALFSSKNVIKQIDFSKIQICGFNQFRPILVSTRSMRGCSSSRFISRTASIAPSSTLSSVNDITIKKIEGYNEFDFKCANVNDGIPFENNIADYIVCSEVMEHLENPTFFLNECTRVLKNGGKLLLTHNPDIFQKDSFIESYNKLDWSKEKIAKAIKFEKYDRLWINYDRLEKIAKSAGFSTSKKLKIPSLLFQSTHMFDLLLEK